MSHREIDGLSEIRVFGHYPPPVTGERVCCLHLIERLRYLGFSVAVATKLDGMLYAAREKQVWVILGSRWGGFLRDIVLLVRQRRVRRFFVYIHNASWRRIVYFAVPIKSFFGDRLEFVVLTEAIAEELRSCGFAASVLRNTVMAKELGNLLVASAPRRILWISAITEEKGFVTAYRAFELLRSADPEWRLDVFGKGLSGSNFPFAQFYGVVQGAAKRNAFSGGGIVVLPSVYANETQPMCLLEAMSLGMPVVASMIGGIPEIVGLGDEAAGLCIRSQNAVELAKALEVVSSKYDHYSRRAKMRFGEVFSPKGFDRQLAAICGKSIDR